MEPPVVRSRGRPRKRRRKEDENDVKLAPEAKKQAMGTRSIALVGKNVLKEFPRNGLFLGKVVYYECGLYRVNYEDGDFEDLDSSEVRRILLNEDDFDIDLAKRRGKLEELVSRNNAKVKAVSEKGSAVANKEESVVDVPVSSELNGASLGKNDEEEGDDDDADADSSSDSSAGFRDRDSGSDAETLQPLLPPLQLPSSSGTIGVPEPCVSQLFAVYGFLRSFSIRLFLLPFTLDEFVGCLNCQISNTLFDAIHVSLLRALRHHLEIISSEGSELASQCLRCNDWSLLDTLTWPVFVIQYLVVNGYTNRPDWKGFYDEVFNGEYYLMPVSRKLMILQILCDDVLESEELKSEMNLRKESEVGTDYDYEAEDIIPSEVGPRKVSASNAVNQPGNSISYLRDTENTEDGDVDRNGDECRLCGMDGTLLCCDGCPSAYHSRCIGVMKMYIPEGPWYCPECKINMTGPTIAKGTSLRGAETFGKDLYGQLFMGTCEHLLVLNIDNDEFRLKYYNQNDIPKVLQVLYEPMQYRPLYHDICMAVLQYWSIPESFLPLAVSTGTDVKSVNIKEETALSTSLPPLGEGNHKPVSLVKEEYPLTTVNSVHSVMVPSLDPSSVSTQSPAPASSGNISSKECPTVNMKLPEDTRMEPVISADLGSVSVSYHSDVNYQSSVNRSSAVDPAKCSLVNSQFINYGHANHTGMPINFSLQTKESTQIGFGKCERNITNDSGYMGFSYKPLSYINYYMHGDFAASAAAKFAILSSEESRSEGHVSDNQRKTASGNTYLQAKAFSLTASRFFWPSSEKKLVEVPRERCGWCFSCKAPISSKRGCMLNHAAISATKSAMKILAGFSPIRSGDGILPSIATYIIYMEECLRGLVVGPFLSASYRRQWRKQVEQATTFSAIKPLLLKLEENIRMIAFCGDWVKLMDDWLVEFSIIQSTTSTLGTTQKRAPGGRRYKKQSAIDEATADGCPENFVWWRGGKFTKFIFQKAVLPKSMIRKTARQGGLRKISGIFYADGSEIPKRSRQLGWRVAVQMSRNASQLALQVRYLDFYLRWSDLIRPEQNIQDGKGQETEASAFRNANICDKKLVEGKSLYGIAFGSQKHLPSRVMKNVVEIEQGPEGKEKYWFSETRIPLYLVKEYEEGNGNVPCDEEHQSTASESHRRRLKAACKDIFIYLTCKRDNLDVFSCSVCHMGVLIRNAHRCSACQGYCHEGCAISSAISANEVEYLTTCKQCYHARLLARKETSNESPTSPLLLQGQESNPGTVLKGPRPKSYDQLLKSARTKSNNPDMKQVTPVAVLKGMKAKCYEQESTSTRTKDSHSDMKQVTSDSTLAAKSHRKNCSWGIIWKKKNNEDTDIDFRLKNILLKGGSCIPQLKPVCHLCRKPYRSDLMYICCETCGNWYHAEAVELEESKISSVLGFKCCKCRRIKSPVCPYSDLKPKRQEGKKSRTRASKKEHSGADSDSGTFSDMRECEPATPVFPGEDDPLLFSLSSVQLITEPRFNGDVDWNSVSGSGLQKLPVRRHVKHEGDGDGSFGDIPLHAEFSIYSDAGNLATPAQLSSALESDTAVPFDSKLPNDSENVNFADMDFEPHTYFSVTELLHPDDSSQFEGVDVSGDLTGYLENSCTLVPEECGDFSLVDKSEPAYSLQDTGYCCWRCSQMEPAPDLCCEICGIMIHSQCSPWVESPSRLGSWRCGNCREWE
ncbi:DDT domain-containing protein PTM-like [Abrus precatorius]|uniref:DDT domain-containing protein PTM-like n=1 Tax=Abrus precatorius TaxID=3816 RepID=A0A8B8KVL7_ABRPR|nr:DDT domain-containing protein PTM-like [Abrus precatorius]